jgi:hypothetical protein
MLSFLLSLSGNGAGKLFAGFDRSVVISCSTDISKSIDFSANVDMEFEKQKEYSPDSLAAMT